MIMTSSLSHDDLADRVKTAGNPILLLDTCTVLDIIRAPVRTEIGLHDIKAVHTLLARATGQTPKVSLVITQKVVEEFNRNVNKVENESRNKIKEISNTYNGILSRMKVLSPSQTFPPTNDLLSYGFPELGRDITEKIMQASSILNDEIDTFLALAARRESGNRPPAMQRKKSLNDCIIIESYLCLTQKLFSDGFKQNMVFSTSNKYDYEQKQRGLHPDLQKEFDAVRLQYAPSWSAARYCLDKQITPAAGRSG